ncbi:MAG: hypothetical protein ABI675_17320 [Chitinophagaceae bacterium]
MQLIIFQVNRRNHTGMAIVLVILFFDTVVYKYLGAGCSTVIVLRCSPTGEIFSLKDSNGNSKYNSVYHSNK